MRQQSVCLASVCFALMLGLPSLQAQVSDLPAKEQTVLTEARGLLDAGKTEAAIELLRKGSKNDSDKAELSFLLGLSRS